ncbi:MAG: biosynthetic-type acetolactate synthase large subunit [Firmicutes bacterium]|nr:biosynthetic-type acetolactate synthase large subunit [Bacillota bacterium]
MKVRAAEALVRCLEREKVDLIFGYPGGAILPVYDALYRSGIKHVLVRHEQCAVHAASGYARVTGRVGVAMATSGPGATNLVTGVATAYMDSVPVVVITGQVPTDQVGTDAFQEVDITGITMPVTKHNYLVTDAREVPRVVREAFHIAGTGRPGPVLIDLPRDVQNAEIEFRYPETVALRGYRPVYRGHPSQIQQAAQMIRESQRPVIYAGGGVITSNAAEELRALAETIGAPVTNTLMGLGSFPGDHPLFLGMLGLHGTKYANLAVTHCDLLIALGARFDDRVTGKIEGFAPQARIIHVDIDPAEIGKNVRIHLPIVGDVKEILRALLPLVPRATRPEWLAQIEAWKREYPLRYAETEGRVKPQFLVEKLEELTRGNAIVVTDVGQHQMWVAQYYRFREPRSLISSGGLGTMGYGLPAAVGAQMGRPDRTVVLVTGDGSLQMTLAELGTVAEQQLPLKIIIMNNQRLGMVRQLQEFYYGRRYMAVDFTFALDFARLAEVYGIRGYTVETNREAADLLPEVLPAPEAVLVNCLIEPEENVLPMVPAGRTLAETVDRGPEG